MLLMTVEPSGGWPWRHNYPSAESLAVLDIRALSKKQLRTAERLFNAFWDKELKSSFLAESDSNRALLDRQVVCDLPCFDEDVHFTVRRLAAKWDAEPSVHGRYTKSKERQADWLGTQRNSMGRAMPTLSVRAVM